MSMANEKGKTPRQRGKATGEARGREDPPASKRLKGDRDSVVESEDESEALYEGVTENRKMIGMLVKQMGDLKKAVLERLPENEGSQRGHDGRKVKG